MQDDLGNNILFYQPKPANDNSPLPSDTDSDALPQDMAGVGSEYLGQRYTLGKYKIMADPIGWIVLCHVPETSPVQPWVTWYYNAQDNSYCSGHYFHNEIDARSDFKNRINQLTIH